MAVVAVIMGSKTDKEYADETISVLEQMGIDHEAHVISAHRTPEKLREFVTSAEAAGTEVFICAAGGAAALPGATAAWTSRPVIGVPLPTSDLNGIDSLYAIAQMPPGIPVATVAVGSWGARNAAFLAAQIVGVRDEGIRKAYNDYRASLRTSQK